MKTFNTFINSSVCHLIKVRSLFGSMFLTIPRAWPNQSSKHVFKIKIRILMKQNYWFDLLSQTRDKGWVLHCWTIVQGSLHSYACDQWSLTIAHVCYFKIYEKHQKYQWILIENIFLPSFWLTNWSKDNLFSFLCVSPFMLSLNILWPVMLSLNAFYLVMLSLNTFYIVMLSLTIF